MTACGMWAVRRICRACSLAQAAGKTSKSVSYILWEYRRLLGNKGNSEIAGEFAFLGKSN
jgi:hypothetical protein